MAKNTLLKVFVGAASVGAVYYFFIRPKLQTQSATVTPPPTQTPVAPAAIKPAVQTTPVYTAPVIKPTVQPTPTPVYTAPVIKPIAVEPTPTPVYTAPVTTTQRIYSKPTLISSNLLM